MSRYLLLTILILPFVSLGILSIFTKYKVNGGSRRKMIVQITGWLIIFIGVACAKPVYETLFNAQLTVSEPLSLFDVVQLTSIVFLLYLVTRMYSRINMLEKRFRDLHQEISIHFSQIDNRKKH